MDQTKQPTNYGALGTLVTVFFFWGFIAASNSIFIPFCKTHFELSQFESQLIGSAFYVAYFFGSLVLFLASNILGYDIINKIGYKKGIIYGLWISVIGALLIIPSANANSFPAILASFFVVALGFSLQQTSAQPFAISLGDPSTGSHRLNMGGSINSFGTTLGPIIVSFFLFGSVGGDHGLLFCAYSNDVAKFDRQLDRMVGIEDGVADATMKYSKCVRSSYWYAPNSDQLKKLS